MNRMGRTRKKRSKRRSHQTLRTRGGDLLAEFHRIISLRETAQQKVDASQNINRRFLKSLKGGTINIERAKPIVNTIANQRTKLTSNFPFSIQPFLNEMKSGNSSNEEAVERLLNAPSELEMNKQLIVEIKKLFNVREQAATAINQRWKNITRRAYRASQMKMVNALHGIYSSVSEEKEDDKKNDIHDSLTFFDQFGENLQYFMWAPNNLGSGMIDFLLKYVYGTTYTITTIPNFPNTNGYVFKYIEIKDENVMKQWIIYSIRLIRVMKHMLKTDLEQEKRVKLDNILTKTYKLTRIISFLLYIHHARKVPSMTDSHTYESQFYRLLMYIVAYMAYQDGNINDNIKMRIIESIKIHLTLNKKYKLQFNQDMLSFGITPEDIQDILKNKKSRAYIAAERNRARKEASRH